MMTFSIFSRPISAAAPATRTSSRPCAARPPRCAGRPRAEANHHGTSPNKAKRDRVPIDVHAHYVPPQLIDALENRGKTIGVRLVRSGAAPPAVHFDYGFKVRPGSEEDTPGLQSLR